MTFRCQKCKKPSNGPILHKTRFVGGDNIVVDEDWCKECYLKE